MMMSFVFFARLDCKFWLRGCTPPSLTHPSQEQIFISASAVDNKPSRTYNFKVDEMLNSLSNQSSCLWHHLLVTTILVVLAQVHGAASVAIPRTSCYTIDNSSHIVDFTSWIGHPFEYEGKDSDLVVRFCKDVESRSQMGYVDFGRFDALNYFVAGSGHISFIQEFFKGDLVNCERSYDKMGRTAQVNIICGDCWNAPCKGPLGCICNITFESSCRVIVELAIPCANQGPRVFQGFTVGFHPRSWEVVYNGMTQLGFEKAHHEFSFSTEQTHLTLYITAIASLSHFVQEPVVKIFPENGLDVQLSGSLVAGKPATTLSPSALIVEWTCLEALNVPYEVEITIPVEGYEPIQFTLTKFCEYRQNKEEEVARGWAIFGVISFIISVLFTLFLCGGFLYRVQFENRRGLDALPGITWLSAYLQSGTASTNGYRRAEVAGPYDYSVQEHEPSTARESARRGVETRYGSI